MLLVKEEFASQKKSKQPETPAHVAIIMDGNGRWAKKRMLPKIAGHKRGADAVRRCVEDSIDLGIRYLTLYAFSSENWNRPEDEVNDLMSLLQRYLTREVDELHEKNIRLNFIGDRRKLSKNILELLEAAEEKTRNNTRLCLTLALSYGGRAEIIDAAKALADKVRTGEIRPEDISEAVFASHLHTGDIPDPDLIIRTSGEQRISNFLLWQIAYAEFVFLDVLWPDFNREMLESAVEEYCGRDRRYGARP
ncbi:Undecaprenyl diphosphate synthase [hydrothermal vent metagenome]|uniref:Undecaprenyl diphosphate synthase n=1 Tax=hydrothermal vent metagenome TaxID=652676 RepID=A0A3B0SM59_9ZZZZ